MKLSLLLTLLFLPALTTFGAETFTCKDLQGQLHISDNLMSLPAECRNQARTSEPDTEPGKVNYVPPVENSIQHSDEFKRAVREEERANEARKRQAAELVRRAESLAVTFEDAVTRRKKAVRSREYGNREEIILAEQQLQDSLTGKKELLDELESAQLSTEQRQHIEVQLERIQD
jgi:hypothetical protein